MWCYQFTPEIINSLFIQGNMIGFLGIECTEVGADFLKAKMPVTERTKQSAGLLHGGANVTLAESIGSLAANLCIDQEKYYAVGLEINANHIRTTHEGWVYATAKPLHRGQSTQIWEIKIVNEDDKLMCICRHTVAVLPKSAAHKMHFNLPKI